MQSIHYAVFSSKILANFCHCCFVSQSVVCHVPAGISAFKWSPDQEILVITTKPSHEGGHLLLMTADWMPVVTEPLNPTDFGEQQPVTVGWGKKETQFHGSEGKEAAKAKMQVCVASRSFGQSIVWLIDWLIDRFVHFVSLVAFSCRLPNPFQVLMTINQKYLGGVMDSFSPSLASIPRPTPE